MNIFGLNKEAPDDIYFYEPFKTKVDTSSIFDVTSEGYKLRVKNKNVNCLFSNLTPDTFEKFYNEFLQHLNLNFSPIEVDGNLYQLTTGEQTYLQEMVITSWIYYYTINNMKVKVKRSDFNHPYMVDYVLRLLDKKYGVDTNVSLTMGASILRQGFEKYCKTVEGRRLHYNR